MRCGPGVWRAVVLTSLGWLLVDVLVLFYYIDTPSSSTANASAARHRAERLAADGNNVRDQSQHREDEGGDRGPTGVAVIDPVAQIELDRLLKGLSDAHEPGAGDGGEGVSLPIDRHADRDKRFGENQFNVVASEMVSVNRTLPDYRSSQCQNRPYDISQLPHTSIIIVFHNEAWSTLLRTLHSVCNRSPHSLVKEIILVDDLSDRPYLKGPLDLYIKRLPIPTHIVHLPERSGLIRARLTGSDMAKGKVLLFLDAHVECTEGWLEPLLYQISQNRKHVVAPIIDVISDDNFKYVTASDSTWGGFNWNLNFRWFPVPKRETNRRGDRSQPIHTPTIAGGLFAIDRTFFYDLGSYDEGMEVWGGENLEISFRTWMCGGRLLIDPCSRVGHVFRKHTPYTFPGGTAKVIHHNAARTAEVWMDDYKQFFYKAVPAAKSVEVGDLLARQKLRKDLGCRNFRWYLENIYPEAPVPAAYYSIGQIRNPDSNRCLDMDGKKDGGQPRALICHGMGGNQAFSLTARGEIRSDELCLAVTGTISSSVRIQRCLTTVQNPKQVFHYDAVTQQITHNELCLGVDEAHLVVEPCSDERALQQKWELENYRQEGVVH